MNLQKGQLHSSWAPKKGMLEFFLHVAHRGDISALLEEFLRAQTPEEFLAAAHRLQLEQVESHKGTDLSVRFCPILEYGPDIFVRWQRRNDSGEVPERRHVEMKVSWYKNQEYSLHISWNAGGTEDPTKGSFFFSSCGLNELLGEELHPRDAALRADAAV